MRKVVSEAGLMVSKEYVRYVVLEESAKLLNRRCFDLGFVPYQSTLADNTLKLFGKPLVQSKLGVQDSTV